MRLRLDLRAKDFSNGHFRRWTAIPRFADEFAAAETYLVAARIRCDRFPETGKFPRDEDAARSAAANMIGAADRNAIIAPRKIVGAKRCGAPARSVSSAAFAFRRLKPNSEKPRERGSG
jgi:hypothetical protein